MKKSKLAAIKARASAATPGPWQLDDDGHSYRIATPLPDDAPQGSINLNLATVTWHTYWGEAPNALADATFIVHAREDIPALLAEIEHLCAVHEGDTAHLAISNQTTYSLNAQLAEAKAREVTLRVEIDRLQTIIRQVASGRATLIANKVVVPDGTEYAIIQPTGLPADAVKADDLNYGGDKE